MQVTVVNLPDWAIFKNEVIWESENKKWRLVRSGDFNEPVYRVLGENVEFPYSFELPYSVEQKSLPKYVQKELDKLRENVSKECILRNGQNGWIVINRWEGSPLHYSYRAHVPLDAWDDETYISLSELRGRSFTGYKDYMKHSNPSLSKDEIYEQCYNLIYKAFPEIYDHKEISQERGCIHVTLR